MLMKQNKGSYTLKLSPLFSDHAVFQRGIPIPVWGWTKPSVLVRATLGDSEVGTLSAPDGRFLLRLPPRPAGGPYELTVTADGESVTVKDVCVGEVWLASGQSNMQMTVAGCGTQGDEAIAASAESGVRMFTVPNRAKLGGQPDAEGAWRIASPDTTGAFSAVAFHFAARLREALQVPVGIINSSWGGTIVEAWTSREALVANPDTRAWTERYEATLHATDFWEIPRQFEFAYPADPGNTGLEKGWARPDFDDAVWPEMELPRQWQQDGHNFSGVFWFRLAVDVPESWAGKDLDLQIGAVDKQDTTYFNGVQIGATGKDHEEHHWNFPRHYTVPGRLVKAGRNVVAVRAYSFVHHGGMIGPANRMGLSLAGGKAVPLIPLAGRWRFHVEHNFGLVQTPPEGNMGPDAPNSPYMLYENMIRPIVPYGIGGTIWYQGESNAADRQYRGKLTALIRDWRRAWGQGDFPFLLVQLANFLNASAYEEGSHWARLREDQAKVLAEPGTGMAVSIDLGEAQDIHPKNKKDVGLRLARWALAQFFGQSGPACGPLYAGMTIEGGAIRLRFDHTGAGLAARDGKALSHFVVAGLNRRFFPAEVRIDGNTVVVRSAAVPDPVAVRYAWADNPEGCNFCNQDGLPAGPFRTDNW